MNTASTAKRIKSKTVKDMKKVGTFKAEFDPAITRYAELREQYEVLLEQWKDGGCKITESYTNKFGATNQRKTCLYLAIETLRKEILDYEKEFGLTPAGLKKIKVNGLAETDENEFLKALSRLENE